MLARGHAARASRRPTSTARSVINFSEWSRRYALTGHAGRRTRTGMMPPYQYRMTQIRGTAPGTRKPFLIDASISQTGRDPERLLAVTARLVER